MAEQGIAGQCGQLARCTGPGSRTVVHLTDEPFRTLMSGQWCIYMGLAPLGTVVHLHGPLGTVVHLHGPIGTVVYLHESLGAVVHLHSLLGQCWCLDSGALICMGL